MKTLLATFALTTLLCNLPAHASPITDTVTVGGKEWAQAADFSGISWATINSVCPLGVCSGTLTSKPNSYDPASTGSQTWNMDGWTWATVDDVNGLFNIYLLAAGVAPGDLLVGNDIYQEKDSVWAAAFHADFRPNMVILPWVASTNGFTRDLIFGHNPYFPYVMDTYVDRDLDGNPVFDTAISSSESPPYSEYPWDTGAWFYRIPGGTVPIPSTLILLGLGLLGLRVSRQSA